MESQCKEYYDDCLSQENARECGIPLLNISVSCAIETDTGVSLNFVKFENAPMWSFDLLRSNQGQVKVKNDLKF